MTNVVDIKEPTKANSKKKTFKKPSKAQYQKMELMQAVSGVTAILKQEGDCAANGTTGDNAIAWWNKGEIMVIIEVCKHGHIVVGIMSGDMKESTYHQLIGFCASNLIEWDSF